MYIPNFKRWIIDVARQRVCWLTLCLLTLMAPPRFAAVGAEFPGLGDPGTPVDLLLSASAEPDQPAVLTGPDARLQLLASVSYDSGQFRDWTHDVTYHVQPEGIVHITAEGLATPLANGTALITAERDGLSADVQVTVHRYDDPPQVNFANAITPILTKLGCNGGGCHGKSGGQNGFALGLLGFTPEADYNYLVHDPRGRRIFPSAPDSSLLLLKATQAVPHGGGKRFKPDSAEYRIIRRWIAQGMPYGSAEDPVVETITTYPSQRVMPHDGKQQLKVLAHYSDGSVDDITQVAQYETNVEGMAEIDERGLVRVLGQPGDVAVMVRYQTFVDTFQATVPLGIEVSELPEPRNFVDELVFAKLKALGMPPSPPADDATFIRRVTLDLTGRLPDAQRVREFLADGSPDKRDRYIDELLTSDAYADFFANKWGAILRNKREQSLFKEGNYAFYQWMRQALLENMPYDQFVTEILTASGPVVETPPAAWFRQVNQVNEQVEDVAQMFLGVRIQCARCHHHPFEKWSQDDYYGLAAFFSRVGSKGQSRGVRSEDYRVFHQRGVAASRNPTSGQLLKPKPLGGEPLELAPAEDPRVALAQWMRSPDNPFFAKTLVNRYWKHFLGRGLVEPEDDIRDTNPPANPQLLQALADHFISSGYDTRQLLRLICQSRTYQFSALPNEYNAADRQAFARYYPRRLEAEVLLDAIDTLNATSTAFGGLPRGMRAVQLPDHEREEIYFLSVFGRPAGASACECERTTSASLAQSLHLLNSAEVNEKIVSGRAPSLAGDAERADAEKIDELYHIAFSRPPSDEELAIALGHLEQNENKQQAFEDIVWAMINTKEFLFNH